MKGTTMYEYTRTDRPMTHDEMLAHPLVRVASSGSWLDAAR